MEFRAPCRSSICLPLAVQDEQFPQRYFSKTGPDAFFNWNNQLLPLSRLALFLYLAFFGNTIFFGLFSHPVAYLLSDDNFSYYFRLPRRRTGKNGQFKNTQNT